MAEHDTTVGASDPEWDRLVAGHRYGHFLQGAGWARFRAGQGWATLRLTGAASGSPVALPWADAPRPLDLPARASSAPTALAQVLVRRTQLGDVGYVPRGPVCAPDDPALPALVRGLRQQLGARCLFVRMEPHWPDTTLNRQKLTAAGLRPAEPTQPPSTVRIDLAVDEATLLGGFKQKWRYNVRLAERSGVGVTIGAEADLADFEELMAVTAARDGFAARPPRYYAAAWRALGADVARLYVARWCGQCLAAILVVHYGDTATYLYGASSNNERQRMPNHLLQWHAMREARCEGRRWYDLWGIPDAIGSAVVAGGSPDDVPVGRGGLWGVWGFKRGFGGAVWRSVGAWDLVLHQWRYRLGLTVWTAMRRRAGRAA